MSRHARPWVLWVSIAVLGTASAQAQIATEGASILVFPKVVADATWDTVIQITNAAGYPVLAHCYYTNGALQDPAQPIGPTNPPLWQQTDFDLFLAEQQPTHWSAGAGRTDDPGDATCRIGQRPSCEGAGLDPGNIPALGEGFSGDLVCIQLDQSGTPVSGNALRGVATLVDRNSGEIAKYNAVGLAGHETNDGGGRLCLGDGRSAECPRLGEYAGCPTSWILQHPSDIDERPVDGEQITTRLTVVPCDHNFETQAPATVALQFVVTNEFEQSFSAATSITCWADVELQEISPAFGRDVLATAVAQTRIRTLSTSPRGFLVTALTKRDGEAGATFTAIAPVATGDTAPLSLIVTPVESPL